MPQPLFSQRLNDFIHNIPFIESSTFLQNNGISDMASASPELQSYIEFYQADYFDLASMYTIGRSDIAGFQIIEHHWRANKPNGKTLYICHGYFDHTGLYPRLIRWGLAQGFDVHSFDMPGHGLSSGEPAAIDSFDQYSEVLIHIINRQMLKDFILIGQSTGCSVIVNALLQSQQFVWQNRPQSIALLAPLVRSRAWGVMRYPYQMLKPFINSIKRTHHPSGHDLDFNDFVENKDPLQASRLPLSWLGAMDQWYKMLCTNTHAKLNPQTSLKALIVQGDADSVVDFKYNLPRLQHYLPRSELNWIAGAEHRLVNESEHYWRLVESSLTDHLG